MDAHEFEPDTEDTLLSAFRVSRKEICCNSELPYLCLMNSSGINMTVNFTDIVSYSN